MKKTLSLIILLLSLIACGDLKITEKQLFVKNIPLSIYYENNIHVQPSSNGFYLSLTKSYTNGDSTDCELISKTQIINAKYDLKGNKIWERIDEKYLPYFVEVAPNEFYNLEENAGVHKFIKYDSMLHKVEETPLFYENYTDLGTLSTNGFIPLGNAKFLISGTVITKGGSSYTYKQFFSIVSIKNGIEKFVLDKEEYLGFKVYKYAINTKGQIYGLGYTTDGKSEIDLFHYDMNFNLLEHKKYIPENVDFMVSSTYLKNNTISILGRSYLKNTNTLLQFDDMFNHKLINFSSYSSSNFIYTQYDDLLLITSNDGLFQVKNDFSLQKLNEVSNISSYSHIEKRGENFIASSIESEYRSRYSSGGGDIHSIIFKENKDTVTTISKTLYQSQYARRCVRGWMD